MRGRTRLVLRVSDAGGWDAHAQMLCAQPERMTRESDAAQPLTTRIGHPWWQTTRGVAASAGGGGGPVSLAPPLRAHGEKAARCCWHQRAARAAEGAARQRGRKRGGGMPARQGCSAACAADQPSGSCVR